MTGSVFLNHQGIFV